jgi:hypothetical protein
VSIVGSSDVGGARSLESGERLSPRAIPTAWGGTGRGVLASPLFWGGNRTLHLSSGYFSPELLHRLISGLMRDEPDPYRSPHYVSLGFGAGHAWPTTSVRKSTTWHWWKSVDSNRFRNQNRLGGLFSAEVPSTGRHPTDLLVPSGPAKQDAPEGKVVRKEWEQLVGGHSQAREQSPVVELQQRSRQLLESAADGRTLLSNGLISSIRRHASRTSLVLEEYAHTQAKLEGLQAELSRFSPASQELAITALTNGPSALNDALEYLDSITLNLQNLRDWLADAQALLKDLDGLSRDIQKLRYEVRLLELKLAAAKLLPSRRETYSLPEDYIPPVRPLASTLTRNAPPALLHTEGCDWVAA